MKDNLLIHSMSEFASVTIAVLEAINAKSVCEIGAEHGGNSKLLHSWATYQKGKFISIDPAPGAEFLAWVKETNDIVSHLSKISLEAISEVGPVDVWFVNGDHNWYTVYHELAAIYASSRKNQCPFMVFLHDVDWPCSRRDAYCAPKRIPSEFVHPHSWELGVTLDKKELIDGGIRGNGEFAWALHEGGTRNGVLTAVEDFVEQHPQEFYWSFIPAIFGLGVLFDRNHPAVNKIVQTLAPFNESPLLAKLEKNRLKNYLKVMEWEDKNRLNAAV